MRYDTLGSRSWRALLKWRRSLQLGPAVAMLAVGLCAWPCLTHADPITAVQAERVVESWLSVDSNPLNTGISQSIGDVMAYPGIDGITNAFYVITMRPAGYVIVAADDLAGSIISFSSKGTFKPTPNNSFYRLLQIDLPTRVAYAKSLQAQGKISPLAQSAKSMAAAAPVGGGIGVKPLDVTVTHPSPADNICRVRVAPLLTSKWGQGDPYNYYTPGNGAPGRVSVFLAEMMRLHQYPTNGISRFLELVQVNESPQWVWTRGGDGVGGPYDWSNMVDDATASGVSVTQQHAVAALCSDIALTLMQDDFDVLNNITEEQGYGSFPARLKSIFGFATGGFFGAYNGQDPLWNNPDEWLVFDPHHPTVPANSSYGMINANLDAGFPVLLGLMNQNPDLAGLVVACDGYGYSVGLGNGVTPWYYWMFHHIEMSDGNAGDDIWYTLPVVQNGSGYTNISHVVFNMMPTNTGEIVSGRVVDTNDFSMPGITLQITDHNTYTSTTVSAGTGIYSFIVPSGYTYYVSVVPPVGSPVTWPTAATQTVVVGTSTAWGGCGNVWGVNFEVPSYRLGGRIIKDGLPLVRAQLILSNVVTISTSPVVTVTNWLETLQTDLDGNFATPVPANWSGILTPQVPGFGGTFLPTHADIASISADNTNITFVWNAPTTYSISGSVFRVDTEFLENVTNAVITFYGEGTFAGVNLTTNTDGNGDYQIQVPTNWIGYAIASDPDGGSFAPDPMPFDTGEFSYGVTNSTGFNCFYWVAPTTNTISGTVIRRDTGEVVTNALLQSSDGKYFTTTDAHGNYTLGPVPYGWSGTLTVSDPFGGQFTPASRTYPSVATPVTGQNYLWTPTSPLVMGFVMSSVGPVSNVVIEAVGQWHGIPFVIDPVATDTNGYYQLYMPLGWSGTIAAQSLVAGDAFLPPSTNVDTTVWAPFYVYSPTYFPPSSAASTTYAISGGVFRADNEANVIDATLYFTSSDGVTTPVFTDTNGNYVAVVSNGWTGTATPWNPDGGAFSPSSNVYVNVTNNIGPRSYYWTPPATNTISGYIKMRDTGSAAVGVVLTTSDGRTVSTDSNGFYSITTAYEWSGSITPSSAFGGVFYPAGQAYVDVRVPSRNQDYLWTPPPPTVIGVVTSLTYPFGAVSNVTIVFSGSVTNMGSYSTQAVTSVDGSYRVTIPVGWSGTATPVSHAAGDSYIPASMPFIDTATNSFFVQNYTWSPQATWAISGAIFRDGTAQAVTNAWITLSNGGGTWFADANGRYVAYVYTNWSGTATPVSPLGGRFSPATNFYPAVTSNLSYQTYYWTPPATVSISGTVRFTNSGKPAAGVLMTADGGHTCTTLADGTYTMIVPFEWSGSITPSSASGGTFVPANQAYATVQASIAGQDYWWLTPPPVVAGVVSSTNYPFGPVSNVTVWFFGSNGDASVANTQAVTGADGSYRVTLPVGWCGTATPSNPPPWGGSFTPAGMPWIDTTTNSLFTQNYTWNPPSMLAISGAVVRVGTLDNVTNATVSFVGSGAFAGFAIAPASTDARGNYVAYVPTNWSGSAIPADPLSGTFSPQSNVYVSVSNNIGFQTYYWTPPATNTISGVVIRRDTGAPVSGVQLLTSDGLTYTTDTNGQYSIPVAFEWSGSVALSDPVGGVFFPLGSAYTTVRTSQSGQDYLWTPPQPVVRGVVISTNYPFGAVSNVVIRFSGNIATGQVVTAADGTYRFSLPVGWIGTATPTNPIGGSFTPSGMPGINTSTGFVFVQNYTWIPPVMYAVSGSVIRVGTLADVTNATITFTGSGVFAGYSIAPVTCDANGNYLAYVPALWTGTATPACPYSGSFSPASNSYASGVTNNLSFQTYLWTPPSTNTISGTILRRDNGMPAIGVQLLTSDGNSVTTDVNGAYSVSVPFEWTGSIAPASTFGGLFRPAALAYTMVRASISGQDYLWTPPAPVIVGMVTNTTAPFGGVANVTIAFSGSSATQVVTGADGSYRISMPFGWAGTATPAHPWGGTFAPAHMPLVDMSTNFIYTQNYAWTPPTMLTISGSVWRSDTLANVTNVVFTFSGGILPVGTDTNGNYLVSVPAGWTGTMTPRHPDLGTFSPMLRAYTNLASSIGFQTFLWTPPLTNSISGTIIRRDNGAPVVGATLTTGDGRIATTDASGNYILPGIPYQWGSAVVPSHPLGGLFLPASLVYADVRASIVNQNYQWMPPSPVISGMVTRTDYPYGPAAGVTITLSSNAGTTVTDAGGSYRLHVGVGWVGTITPSHAVGGVFTPSNSASIDTSTNFIFIQNFQWLPPPMTISGLVTRADDGTPVSNVVSITFANATNGVSPVITPSPSTVHTGTNGWYGFSVPFGWAGTAVPTHPFGGTFAPPTNTYLSIAGSHASDNYVWTPPPPAIAGRVIRFDTGAPVTNASIIFSNADSLVLLGATNPLVVAVTDSNGSYRVSVGSGWSGTVTPVVTQFTGAVFVPAQRAFTNVQADVTDTNRTQFVLYPPPALFIALANPSSRGSVYGAVSGWYTVGAALSITAMPNSVSRFAAWQDNVSNAARTVVLVPGTNTYVANFVDLGPSLTIIGADPAGGIDFGGVMIGKTATRKIIMKNTGTSSCTIMGTAPPATYQAIPSVFTLDPGATNSVSLVFTPLSESTFTGLVTWATYPEPVSGAPTLFVQGTGLGLIDVLDFSGSISFGYVLVGQRVTRSFQIRNLSGMPLTLSAKWSNGNGYSVSGFPATLAANATKIFTITFAPTAIAYYGGAGLTISAAGIATAVVLVPSATVAANVGGTWTATLNKQNYSLYLRQNNATVDGIMVCKQNAAINDQYVANISVGSLTGALYYASNSVGRLMLTAPTTSTLTGALTRTGIGLGPQYCKWTRSSTSVPSSVHFLPRPGLAVKPQASVQAGAVPLAAAAPEAALHLTLLDLVPAATLPEDAELVVVTIRHGRPVAISPALDYYNLAWLLQTRLEPEGVDANTNGLPDLIEAALGVPLQDGMKLLIVRKHEGFAVPNAPYSGTSVEGAAVPVGTYPATWTLTPAQP